jgi:hypothetical protein
MAGYILQSLDSSRLIKFMQTPSKELVRIMGETVSDLLDEYDSDLEDGDSIADWPSEVEQLAPILVDHVQTENWYADFLPIGQRIWEEAFTALCENEEQNPFKFQYESDGIYWNIVEEAVRYHQQPKNQLTDLEITHFGTRPFRYRRDSKWQWGDWSPTHSMHTPQEVAALAEQFAAAEDAIRMSPHEETEMDYEELMSVLDKLRSSERILYVQVDT